MALAPVHFLHAADIFLDSPLSDIPAGIALSPEIEQRLENATITAFDRMIEAAVEAKVDFVLLTGNTFVEDDQSLAARIALLDGLYRLADEGIRVFVTPGEHDPADAWRAIPDLPENVTIFFERESEPVAAVRDGKVIATVAAAAVQSLHGAKHSPGERRGPFRVILLTTPLEGEAASRLDDATGDYFALLGNGSRRTISFPSGLAHHPGPTQGLFRSHCGPHGATLVAVDAAGKIETTCIPTAAAILEALTLNLDERTTFQDLLELMHAALEPNSDLANQPIRVIDWQVRGSGAIAGLLLDETERAKLSEAYLAKYPTESARRTVHTFHLERDYVTACGDDATASHFFEALNLNDAALEDALAECLEGAANSGYAEQLLALVPNLDKSAILARARRLGAQWFRPTETGERP